jgi:hypothetical protein
MPIVIPATGERNDLLAILGQGLTLRLFSNNVTITKSTVVGNLTEASGNGYAAISLTSGSWVLSGSNPTTASYPKQTFTFTGAAGNLYGYYITKDADGSLCWAENETANIAHNGDKIEVTLSRTQV